MDLLNPHGMHQVVNQTLSQPSLLLFQLKCYENFIDEPLH